MDSSDWQWPVVKTQWTDWKPGPGPGPRRTHWLCDPVLVWGSPDSDQTQADPDWPSPVGQADPVQTQADSQPRRPDWPSEWPRPSPVTPADGDWRAVIDYWTDWPRQLAQPDSDPLTRPNWWLPDPAHWCEKPSQTPDPAQAQKPWAQWAQTRPSWPNEGRTNRTDGQTVASRTDRTVDSGRQLDPVRPGPSQPSDEIVNWAGMTQAMTRADQPGQPNWTDWWRTDPDGLTLTQ